MHCLHNVGPKLVT